MTRHSILSVLIHCSEPCLCTVTFTVHNMISKLVQVENISLTLQCTINFISLFLIMEIVSLLSRIISSGQKWNSRFLLCGTFSFILYKLYCVAIT